MALGLLILAVVVSIFVYHSRMLRNIISDVEKAWDREEGAYKKTRDKDISRLYILGRELEKLNQAKIEAEKQITALSSEKDKLERERKITEENLQKVEREAREALARQERELKDSLAQQYKNEIEKIKEKAGEAEKIEEGLKAENEALQKIEEALASKDKELERFNEKNRELLDGLKKANRSNEYLTQKIEDLQKVRKELEEELRRRAKSVE